MPIKKYNLPKGLQNKPVGSENWYQIFYRKDRHPTIKWVRLGAHNLSGAKVERERLLRTYELGLFDPWERTEKAVAMRNPLVEEAVAEYLEEQRGLALTTRNNKRSKLGVFTKGIGRSQSRTRQIGEAEVEGYVERSHLKELSRQQCLTELSTFFTWCQDMDYVEVNPAREYKRRRNRGLSAYTRRMRNGEARQALMPDDLVVLLDRISAVGKHMFFYDVVLFALATGLRRSELEHVNRRDVQLDDPPRGIPYPVTGRIRVRCWTNRKTGEQFVTKNGKDRIIPLCPVAAQIACRNLEAYATEDDWLPLFRAPKGGRIVVDRLSEWFHQYRTQVQFTDRVTFHSLRHSFASWIMMLGVNPFSIKRLLGHSSLSQLDVYAELCEEYLLGNARNMQRQMLDVLCPNLSERLIDRILPKRHSLLAALSDQPGGRAQPLQSILPMEDVLFSGVAYETAPLEQGVDPYRTDEERFELLEIF